MYGYNKYIPLNIKEILKRTKEEDIFKIVIQQDIVDIDKDSGANYLAPYRKDTNPSCYFRRYQNKLWFVDFAKSIERPGIDCFQLIKKCYNCPLDEALKIINNELKLGLGDNLGKVKKIIHDYVEEKNVNKVFKERVITFSPRKFNYKDKQFWSNYEISRENLIEDGVIPIDLYKSTSKKGDIFSIRPIDICYAYTEFSNNKVKIYRPHASKNAKWFTNCNQNDIGSIKHLPKTGKTLIISKSYKDCRVIRNQKLNSIWFQNEGMIPSKSVLLDLCTRFENIIVWFDNDNTGITNSRIITNHINTISKSTKCKSITIPPRLLKDKIKDPSDYFAIKGKQSIIKLFKKLKLY